MFNSLRQLSGAALLTLIAVALILTAIALHPGTLGNLIP